MMKTAMFTTLLTFVLALFSTNGLQAQVCNPANCSIEMCKKMMAGEKVANTKTTCAKKPTAEVKTVALNTSVKNKNCKQAKANCCPPMCCTGNAKSTATACKQKAKSEKAVADLPKKVALN